MSEGTTISGRLKAETAELHTAAERHPMQHALATGLLSRAGYVAWLGQMLVLHRALEEELAARLRGMGPVAYVVTPEEFQVGNLEADLAHFGVDSSRVAGMPGVQRAIAQMREHVAGGEAAILGWWYVCEGSKNGAAFIARVVRRELGLTPGHGDRFLDPYGASQRERWAAWKTRLDAAAIDPGDHAAMIDAARAMFRAAAMIGDDVLQAVGADAVLESRASASVSVRPLAPNAEVVQ